MSGRRGWPDPCRLISKMYRRSEGTGGAPPANRSRVSDLLERNPESSRIQGISWREEPYIYGCDPQIGGCDPGSLQGGGPIQYARSRDGSAGFCSNRWKGSEHILAELSRSRARKCRETREGRKDCHLPQGCRCRSSDIQGRLPIRIGGWWLTARHCDALLASAESFIAKIARTEQ